MLELSYCKTSFFFFSRQNEIFFAQFIHWHLLYTVTWVSGDDVKKVTYNNLLPDKSYFIFNNIFHIFQHPLTVRVSFKIIDHSAQRKFQDGFVCYCYWFSWIAWYMIIWGHIFGGLFFRDLYLINRYNAFCFQIANLCKHKTSPA